MPDHPGPDFASATLFRHLVRGVLGFGAFAAAIALVPVTGFLSLLMAPLGLVALRGCPTCWTIGLIQTVSRGRLERACGDGRCELRPAARDGGPAEQGAVPPAQRAA